MEVPKLYQKLLDLCREQANHKNQVDKRGAASEVARRFRLTEEDVDGAFKELEGMGRMQPINRLRKGLL